MPADSPPPAPLNDTVSPLPLPPPPPHQQHDQQQLQQQVEQQQQLQQQVEQQQQQDEQQRCEDVTATQPQNDEHNLVNQPHDVVSPPDLDLSDVEDPDPPPEFVFVDLLAIRKEVQCPICLGIIKKTRTVMECLHRFCRECIDKSMRMGNNECPACRTHCPSRRSLRDDPRYDELIAALYPDIKKFEEEELAFYEEDESRNKEIQDSITQVIEKQTEALGKKRSGNRDTAGTSAARSQRTYRGTQSRRRRRRRKSESQDSDFNMDVDDSDKNHSPDEQHQETNQRKRKGRANATLSQSPSTTALSGGSIENNVEQSKEERGLSPGLTRSPELLAWGRGGVRSTTRHGNSNGSMIRSTRSVRIAKLGDFFRNLEEKGNERMALDLPCNNKNGQLNGTEDTNGHFDHQSTLQPSSFNNDNLSQVAESLQDKFHVLNAEEKLSGVLTSCAPNGEHLVSACQPNEAM